MAAKNIQDINLEEFIDHMPKGICRSSTAPKGRLFYSNATFQKMLGVKSAEANKLTIDGLFAQRRQYQDFRKKLLKEGVINNFEACLKGKNKKVLWVSISATTVKNGKSKIKWVNLIIDDVSARKRFEKELIESKDLFQTVFNNTAAAITVTDKNEQLVAWNPFAEKMLGMTRADLFNMPIKNLYPPAEWRRLRSFQIRKKGMKSDIETKIIKKDGKILEVSISISVLKDLDGNITGSIGIIRDITNQKNAERKIRESENKIRIILDNSAVAITLTDDQERIVSWNKFTEKLLGLKKKDLYLKHVSTLYPSIEWEKIRAERIRQMGSKHHLESKVIKKDGTTIDIDLSVNVLQDAQKNIIGSVGIMQDITQQKRTQELLIQAKLAAEEANSAKSLFLANMSHEVRTPMNTIIGMIDLTLDTKLDKEQQDNLNVAKDACDNLLSLLNDILDLSRVEAGKIKLENIEFDLHNVAKSVCKGMSVLARDKNLKLELNIHSKTPEYLEGDPVRLRQVLVNLINNAIKFTHKGTVTTEISLASKTKNEVMILFSVIDDGIGIPKDKQEKIFDVFSQAETSTSRRFGGTGLGLAISKKLVDMMGGRIWVESEECKGSKFSFTASFKAVESSRVVTFVDGQDEKDVDEHFIKENLKGLKILLAEDNPVNQKIAIRLLEKQNWDIEAVLSGEEVLDRINQESYNLILMDASMPGLDGLETTKIIRKNERKTGQHIPIIALTARAMQEDKKRCLDAGMDGYVSKPIDRRILYATIINLFKKGQKNG